jgi:hypothetical protein
MTDELESVGEEQLEGQEAPVADAEGTSSESWPKEVQAEYTRKSQALADERKQWEQHRDQWTSQAQNQHQQLQQYAQQLQQQQGAASQQATPQQQAQTSMVEQLKGMSYLDGPTAAALVERIMGEGIAPLNTAIQQRDKALTAMYQKYKTLEDSIGKQQGKQTESELETRFAKAREDHGLPDEEWAHEYLRDVYYSHEGADLNNSYSDMVRTRLDAMRKGIRDMDRQAAQQAKTSPFPSKGGEMSPVKGKTGGYKTPQQRADELWPMINPGSAE